MRYLIVFNLLSCKYLTLVTTRLHHTFMLEFGCWFQIIDKMQCDLFAELRIRCVKLTSISTTCIISSPNPMFRDEMIVTSGQT